MGKKLYFSPIGLVVHIGRRVGQLPQQLDQKLATSGGQLPGLQEGARRAPARTFCPASWLSTELYMSLEFLMESITIFIEKFSSCKKVSSLQ